MEEECACLHTNIVCYDIQMISFFRMLRDEVQNELNGSFYALT